jgi:hypothetical protein
MKAKQTGRTLCFRAEAQCCQTTILSFLLFPFHFMSDKLNVQDPTTEGFVQPLYAPIKRRSFFMYAGATAGATALVLAGCSKDDDNNQPAASGIVDVGSGDVGVLNYAYALEQLEAAFYAKVLTGTYFTNLNPASAERQIFTDIALHERIHADFFKAAITAAAPTQIIPDLKPDFSKIDFNSRDNVLATAKTFEDLGVAAYNGAGRFITDAKYLTLAGKIVSVEARHAGLIRDMISANSFVGEDVVNFNLTGANARQEKSKLPAEVVAAANGFLMEGSKISATKLV